MVIIQVFGELLMWTSLWWLKHYSLRSEMCRLRKWQKYILHDSVSTSKWLIEVLLKGFSHCEIVALI